MRQKAQAPSYTQSPRTSPLGDSDGFLRHLPAMVIWLLLILLIAPPEFDYEKISGSFTIVVSAGGSSGPIILISSLLVSVLLVLWRLTRAIRIAPHINIFLFLFVGMATLSVLWSADPSATMRRLFRLYVMFLAGLAFVLVGWERRRLQEVLRPVVTFVLIGSIIFGLTSPELAIEKGTSLELAGAWKGLTMQKNSLGALATMGVLLWTHALFAGESRKIYAWPGLAISCSCVILSRSSTAIFSSALCVGFLFLLLGTRPAMRRYLPYIVGTFATLVIVYSLAVLNLVPGLGLLLEPVAALTGKDLSFSGRTTIWNIVIESIQQRPILGTGYGAYWTGPVATSLSYPFVTRTYIYPTQAHNGYLDVINELGYVGGFVLIGFIVTYLRQAIHMIKIDKTQAALYLAMLFQALIANLSEAHWFSVAQFPTFWMILAALSIGRHMYGVAPHLRR